MTEAEIRALFPGVERRRYFNSAACSLLPRAVEEAVGRTLARQVADGIHAFVADMADVEAARERAARRIGAAPRDVALLSTTAEAIARVASGFPWEPGDEVVLGDLEYPANVYPWAAQTGRGVRVRVVASEAGRLPAERLAEAIGPRTRVVAVSTVQFSTGYRVDLESLSAECRRRGVFLAVDAIQSLGVLPVDVARVPVGCLAADGRKWLFGPSNCSVLYVDPEWSDRIRPAAPGALSVTDAERFLQWTDWARPDGTIAMHEHWRPGAGRFENGFPNTIGAAGLAAALETAERIGPAVIHERVTSLASRLARAVEDRGWRVHGPRDDRERAGIVVFEPPGEAAALGERLGDEGYSVSVRDGRLRASPHVYNTVAEVDDLVETIARVGRSS